MKVRLPEALRARPASLLVRLASRYSARVALRLEGRVEGADAQGVSEILALAAAVGDELEIAADGSDAEAAMRARGS